MVITGLVAETVGEVSNGRNGPSPWLSGCRWHHPLRGGHCVIIITVAGDIAAVRFSESDGRIHHIPDTQPVRPGG
nr:hypothetical protein [Escherichia coli]